MSTFKPIGSTILEEEEENNTDDELEIKRPEKKEELKQIPEVQESLSSPDNKSHDVEKKIET